MASASFTTSPSAASQTSAMALMKEILVARKELAEVFTSSAVGKSVTTKGEPSAIGVAYTSRSSFSARSLRDADHDPVRVQGVLDGEALAQELRVPGQLGVLAGGGQLGQPRGEPVGAAHRHGGLADDQRGPGQVRGERVDGGCRRSDMSQAYSPCFCGVFTQTKWTSPNAPASS